MKKVSSLMILLLAGVMMFVSCSSPSSGGGNKFSLSNYQFTDEVKLMDTPDTITGSEGLNLFSGEIGTGAFPAGRTVTLSPFIMGKYEVTQELYEAVMTGQKVKIGGVDKNLKANPSYCTSTADDYKKMLEGEIQEYRPVEGVTWYDACYFCNALSEKLGLKKAYDITVTTVTEEGNIIAATVEPVTDANGYRLPTEAEWEYAARGGDAGVTNDTFANYWSGATTTDYSSPENEELDNAGWYLYNISSGTTSSEEPSSGAEGYGTHQVGKKPFANAAGLYDMSGNVWEWCYDWHDSNIALDDESYKKNGVVTDPSGPSGDQSDRVRRGGSWLSNGVYFCAVSYRARSDPGGRNNNLGFRVVRNAQ